MLELLVNLVIGSPSIDNGGLQILTVYHNRISRLVFVKPPLAGFSIQCMWWHMISLSASMCSSPGFGLQRKSTRLVGTCTDCSSLFPGCVDVPFRPFYSSFIDE